MAFTVITNNNFVRSPSPTTTTNLYYTRGNNNNNGGGAGDSDSFDTQTLEKRLQELRVTAMEEEYKRPPNPELDPQDFIFEILLALWNNAEPLPDSGFRTLLRASTKEWRRKLYDSIGAPSMASEEVVASAVGEALQRPKNQYAILTGDAEHYVCQFPGDVLDYGDGTCFVECRLRDFEDDTLLIVMGWELQQRESDGAWLVARIDWQDFRGKFVARRAARFLV